MDFIKILEQPKELAKIVQEYTGEEEIGNSGRDIIQTFSVRVNRFVQLLKHSKLITLGDVLNSKKRIVIFRAFPNLQEVYSVFNSIYFMLLFNEILTMPDTNKLRFLFLLDEAGTLSSLAHVSRFISLCRSKGAGVVVASQSLSQLREHKDNILNNCNYKIVGRLNDLNDVNYFDAFIAKLGKEGKKYQSVSKLPDRVFYFIDHLGNRKIRKSKINYFKL